MHKLHSTCDVTFWKLLFVLYWRRSCWSPRDIGGREVPTFLSSPFNFRPEILDLLQNLLVHSLHFCILVLSAW